MAKQQHHHIPGTQPRPLAAERSLREMIAREAQGKKTEAKIAYDKAMRYDSQVVATYHLTKGEEHTVAGNYTLALNEYDKAIVLNPELLQAYYNKGGILNALSQYQDAFDILTLLIAKDTENHFTHKALSKQGVALSGLKKPQEALAAQEASISMRPTVAAWCHKGVLLYAENKDDEALACFDHARILETSSPSPLSHSVNVQKYSIGSYRVKQAAESIEHKLRNRTMIPQMGVRQISADLSSPKTEDAASSRDTLRKTLLDVHAITTAAQETVAAIPTNAPPAVLEAITRFKSIIHRSKEVTTEVVSKLSEPKTATIQNEERVVALEKKLADMQEQMQGLVTTLHDSGVYEIAQIKREFAALDEEMLAYCTTFYWSVINLIGAYRHIGTGVIDGNVNADTSKTKTILVAGAKKLAGVATEFAKGIPFVGCIVSALDKVIGMIYDAYKQQQLDGKVGAINNIVQSKFLTEAEVSQNIAAIALEMTHSRVDEIDASKDIAQESNGWIFTAIMDALSGEDHSKPYGARLALKDVALFMAHLCTKHKTIVASSETFKEQIPNIVQSVGTVVISQGTQTVDVVTEVVVQTLGEVAKVQAKTLCNDCCTVS